MTAYWPRSRQNNHSVSLKTIPKIYTLHAAQSSMILSIFALLPFSLPSVGCLERGGICNKVMGHEKGAYFLDYACV